MNNEYIHNTSINLRFQIFVLTSQFSRINPDILFLSQN